MASAFDIQQARGFAAGLRSYWQWAARGGASGQASVGERRERLETAQTAMDHIAWRAVTDDDYKAVVREFQLVETALTVERLGYTDLFCMYPGNKRWDQFALDLDPDDDQKPPRLTLLEAMHSCVKGEMFRTADKRGVVPWLASSSAAANAFAASIEKDYLPVVWFALFGILLNSALPASWVISAAPMFGAEPAPAPVLVQTQAFVARAATVEPCMPLDGVHSECATMPQNLRSALHSAASRTLGQLQQSAANAARASSSLPASAGGGGSLPPDLLLPGKARPWWQDGRLVSLGLLGLAGGAWLSARK